MAVLEFDAELVKVSTLKDGATRVVMDLPEYEIADAVQLVALTGRKPLVRVTIEEKRQ